MCICMYSLGDSLGCTLCVHIGVIPCIQRSSSSVYALLLAAVCMHVHRPQIQVLSWGTPFGAVLHEFPNISPWRDGMSAQNGIPEWSYLVVLGSPE